MQRVVPFDQVEAETRRWAEELAKIPSERIQNAKMSIHRQYELMGLANMEMVQNKITGHAPTDQNQAWWKDAISGGVKGAVQTRNEGFDDDVARL